MSSIRSAGRPWTRVCLAVFERDAWTCRWCARTVHRTRDCARGGCRLCAHGDHWPVGLAEGQAMGMTREQLDQPGNVVTACRRCNQRRGVGQAAVARRRRRVRQAGGVGGHRPVRLTAFGSTPEATNGAQAPVGGSFLTSTAGDPTRTAIPPRSGAPAW